MLDNTPIDSAMHHHECRYVSAQWDEHGCLEIRAKLTPEQSALVIKAIEAAFRIHCAI